MPIAVTRRSPWRGPRRLSPCAARCALPNDRMMRVGDCPSVLVIACGALAREIAALRRANGWPHLDVRCLPAELHNRPERIPGAVRDAIRANRGRYASI